MSKLIDGGISLSGQIGAENVRVSWDVSQLVNPAPSVMFRNGFEIGDLWPLRNKTQQLPPTSNIELESFLVLARSYAISDQIGFSFYTQALQFGKKRAIFEIETDYTKKLSKQLGFKVSYQLPFAALEVSTRIGLRYSDFRLYGKGKKLSPEFQKAMRIVKLDFHGVHAEDELQKIENIGIILDRNSNLNSANQAREKTKAIRFKIEATDFNPYDYVPSLDSMFNRVSENGETNTLSGLIEDIIAKVSYTKRGIGPEADVFLERLKSFHLRFRKAYDDVNAHRAAAQIAANGPDAINRAFQDLEIDGSEFLLLQGKNQDPFSIKPYTVGKPLKKGANLFSDVLEPLKNSQIPYEVGSFAETHGAFAHHAQILGLMLALDAKDRAILYDSINQLGERYSRTQWILWNGFFDGTGNQANSPVYWRDLINEEIKKLN